MSLINQDKKDMKHECIIEVQNVKKHFNIGSNVIEALNGIDLKINATDFAVIFGDSGCGKSTLLNIIAGIDTPDSGKVKVRNTNIDNLDDDERGVFRSKKMGIVYQFPYWIKSLNVLENVALPLIISGTEAKNALERAEEVMEELKISKHKKQLPTQLSGGQQQKVGIARALVSNPWIILADEPTGNLHTSASDEIMSFFSLLNQKYKRTIILVTHNQSYWDIGNRRIMMKDGLIAKEANG